MDQHMEIIDIFENEQKLDINVLNLIREWREYKQMLMEKYPAEEGCKWRFSCDHHRKIDNLN